MVSPRCRGRTVQGGAKREVGAGPSDGRGGGE
jgi:hypothetical protein